MTAIIRNREPAAAYFPSAVELPGQQLPWLQAFRKEAQTLFSASGFPSPRAEEWRYTNVSALAKKPFKQQGQAEEPALDGLRLASLRVAEAHVFVFIDGFYAPGYSDAADLPHEVRAMTMSEALLRDPGLVQDYLGQAVTSGEHGFVAFNNAGFSDGLVLQIPAGCRLARPVQIINIVTRPDALAAGRSLVIARERSDLQFIETFAGFEHSYLTDSVTELFIEPEARVTFYKLQRESEKAYHFGGLYVKQGENSVFTHQNFAFGGFLARSDIHADLAEAAECTLNGLYVAAKRCHIDNHTRIHHGEPFATSRELYKGIVDDRARGVFQGRVIVAENAQKTDSQMSNRNLLLSNDAEADTKPQLEIYADDVKCGHGVTVGQLDEKSTFYLESRGIDQETARNMLTFAFANEMVEKITLKPLHDQILRELLRFFPQENVNLEWL